MDVAGVVFSRPLIALDANIPNIKKKEQTLQDIRHLSLMKCVIRQLAAWHTGGLITEITNIMVQVVIEQDCNDGEN